MSILSGRGKNALGVILQIFKLCGDCVLKLSDSVKYIRYGRSKVFKTSLNFLIMVWLRSFPRLTITCWTPILKILLKTYRMHCISFETMCRLSPTNKQKVFTSFCLGDRSKLCNKSSKITQDNVSWVVPHTVCTYIFSVFFYW